MKKFEPQELKNILEKHRKWVMNESEGERADLSSANLRFADLSSANLRSADLRSANLSSADLRSADLSFADLRSADLRFADLRFADLSSANLSSADLRSANLRFADLRSANLRSADLSYIIEDFYKVLDIAKTEVPELYKSIWDGKINGSQYQGECACLVGTIANIKKCNFEHIEGLKPDSSRLSEKWFLGISPGDMPQNSAVAKITAEWLEKYMEKQNIKIPIRRIEWA